MTVTCLVCHGRLFIIACNAKRKSIAYKNDGRQKLGSVERSRKHPPPSLRLLPPQHYAWSSPSLSPVCCLLCFSPFLTKSSNSAVQIVDHSRPPKQLQVSLAWLRHGLLRSRNPINIQHWVWQQTQHPKYIGRSLHLQRWIMWWSWSNK